MSNWVERLSTSVKRPEISEDAWRYYETDTSLGKKSISKSVSLSPIKYRSFSSATREFASPLKKYAVDEIPSASKYAEARHSRVSSTDRLPNIPNFMATDPYEALSFSRRCSQWVRDPKRSTSAYTSTLPRFAQFGKRSDAKFISSNNLGKQKLEEMFRFHK